MIDEIEDKYNQAVVKWLVANDKTDVSEHIIDIITSALLTRNKIKDGGGFVQALVKNDLKGAIGRADSQALDNLVLIVKAYNNIDIF